jgi:hypothetical protein
LFQQQGGTGTVKAAGAVTVKTVPFRRHSCAGVLVDPSQGEIESMLSKGLGQSQAITATMTGLPGEPLGRIEGQSHHQHPDAPLTHKGGDGLDIDIKILAMQGFQGGHRDAEGITTRQTDAAMAHIQGEGRAG